MRFKIRIHESVPRHFDESLQAHLHTFPVSVFSRKANRISKGDFVLQAVRFYYLIDISKKLIYIACDEKIIQQVTPTGMESN